MTPRRTLAVLIAVLCATAPAFAHRLDQYLQAATIGLAADGVTVRLRLTPGASVLGPVLAAIDTDGDGVLSDAERQAYVGRVRQDLSLWVDGRARSLRPVAATFPAVDAMRDGLGEIDLTFAADVPPGGPARTLAFENRHQYGVAAYLANCLVPRDPRLRVTGQDRSYDQSSYRLTYTQDAAVPTAGPAEGTAVGGSDWLGRTGSASLAKAFAYAGVRHILTGYDHLLFVSALALAAATLWDLIKVVSAFTFAHTLTLTLAALGWVHVSGRIVEPLIAGSIVCVAMQNVLWPGQARGGARLAAAAFFGLFHGLGFAGGLLDAMREMPGGTMFVAIFAFSVGVEAGHQTVVLPLFTFLKTVRRTRPDAVARARLAMAVRRIGSAGISVAGAYYLAVALFGPV